MRDNFDAALALILKSEGGFVNNHDDPGGATNRGITQAVYTAYRRGQSLSPRPVKQITAPEVRDIYFQQYWKSVQADDLWKGLDYAVFDEAVNSGPKRSIKDLQTALGVKADGWIGIETLTAMRGVNDRKALINRICDLRLNWLHRLATWRVFGRGWANRIAAERAAALAMVAP